MHNKRPLHLLPEFYSPISVPRTVVLSVSPFDVCSDAGLTHMVVVSREPWRGREGITALATKPRAEQMEVSHALPIHPSQSSTVIGYADVFARLPELSELYTAQCYH
jgi:hypothetical protein